MSLPVIDHYRQPAVSPPAEAPWDLAGLGAPAVAFAVYGTPAPQGSKKGFATKKGGKYTGKVSMVESSKKVKPWRDAVAAIAEARRPAVLMIGPLVADLVFTLPRPTRFPKGKAEDLRWLHGRPTTYPDLSKLARSTEDALTGVVWHDDSHVIAYRRLEKVYVGSRDPDALSAPGAVIRVWTRPMTLGMV